MAVTRIPLPDWARTQRADDRLELPLAETELSVRTVNCLEEQAIFTIKDLLNCTPEQLLEIPNSLVIRPDGEWLYVGSRGDTADGGVAWFNVDQDAPPPAPPLAGGNGNHRRKRVTTGS